MVDFEKFTIYNEKYNHKNLFFGNKTKKLTQMNGYFIIIPIKGALKS